MTSIGIGVLLYVNFRILKLDTSSYCGWLYGKINFNKSDQEGIVKDNRVRMGIVSTYRGLFFNNDWMTIHYASYYVKKQRNGREMLIWLELFYFFILLFIITVIFIIYFIIV